MYLFRTVGLDCLGVAKPRVGTTPSGWIGRSFSAQLFRRGKDAAFWRCDPMGKYDPLRDHLRRQKADEFDLTFQEIERKLGAMLPNSAVSHGGGPT